MEELTARSSSFVPRCGLRRTTSRPQQHGRAGCGTFRRGRARASDRVDEKRLAINPRATWVYRNLVPADVAAGRDANARKGIATPISEDRALSVAAVRDVMVFTHPTMARISEGPYRARLSRA